ncbi:hypothetical protein N7495_007049 [Penicillium taxi]|uniref:uncharacterized protein n=1 Tax=Penicillium taxi TaxID=168475 RepID=UPI002545B346|nr:uncharacterized protein N7495_007049 [Penicillium taxi]KAJ5895358.1 hypothetical protein N7495_007049 [Penicillium taxi]
MNDSILDRNVAGDKLQESPISFASQLLSEFSRSQLIGFLTAGWLAYIVLRSYFSKTLPPSPRRLPVLGNLHQAPLRDHWAAYKTWHKQHGPIISLRFGQRTIISLGSHQVANELLNKRSQNYSSRPNFVVGGALSNNQNSALIPYGEQWKIHHSMLTKVMNARMAAKYQFLQNIESKQAMKDLLSVQGKEWIQVFHRYTTSVTYTLAYGERLKDLYDERIHFVDELTEIISSNVEKPTNLIADCFPILDNLPAWLAPWKRLAKMYHGKSMDFFLGEHTKAEQRKSWNWVKELAESDEAKLLDKTEVVYLIGVLIEAGGSTMKTFEFFVMAAILFPEAVHRAQEELDRVVGSGRLPDWDDQARLPYLNAFIREVQRWRPIFPLGVPHSNQKEEIYDNYRIPKDSVVIANHWVMDSDHDVFKDADDFRPERWIEDANLPFLAFGYGKRVCPGQHIAKRSLYIVISRVLWGFNISHAQKNGKRIELDPNDLVQNILSGPKPYKAAFKVRSAKHRHIIENEFGNIGEDERQVWEVCKP